jgi:N-acetylmuramoyl-L-alanine amidase
MKRLLTITTVILVTLFWCCCCSVSINNSRADKDLANTTEATRPKTVCIDPGHPSEVNSGKTIQNGTTEVHVAWVVALKLEQILKADGFKVIMTKSREDELVRNKDRAAICNSAGADLMVRLHCDAGADEGFAIYFPDRQATKDDTTGPSQRVIEQSKLLAQAIDREMSQSLSGTLKNGGVRGDSQTAIGSKQGALTASIFSEIPIVTIEMVVLNNKVDAEFIKSETAQQRMAQAIADGIQQFVRLGK